MMDNKLGERLKARRVEKGMSLRVLSGMCGVHASHLGRIERGERQPSAPILCALGEPLDFTEVELLKMAGYLSPDLVDDRIERFKIGIKGEITQAMARLLEKVDSF